MKKRGRREFDAQFKQEAVRLAESGTMPIAEVARQLGVHVETLRSWRRQAQGRAGGEAAATVPSLEEENRRLRRENARLLEEREILKSHGLLRQGCTMRFVFIHAHERIFHITTMRRVLAVSRAGFYKWRAQPVAERVQADAVLAARIRAIHTGRRRCYGSPRVHRELRDAGVRCGEKRVARVMRQEGIRATTSRRYRVTTQSGHRAPVAANHLARRFGVTAQPGLNAVWAADITYLPTREGWLYLAVVLDLASRRVVGWAVRTRLEQELALGALRMALRHRGARGGVHHSDRGVQYASAAYQALLAAAQFTPSMSRVRDCWDNAVVESFFATVTKELLVDGLFESRALAARELFQFIELWYNRQRRHSSLGYRSPVQYEEELRKVS